MFCAISLSTFAQKKVKDADYYYNSAQQEPTFMAYLKAKRQFDEKRDEFKLPKSPEAVQEIEKNRDKIMKNERTYAEFLSKHGMANAGEYASLWFNQLTTLKTFIKKNPQFGNLSVSDRQKIISKWYYADESAKK